MTTATAPRSGVYQTDAGDWAWASASDQGGPYPSREAARAAYWAHRKATGATSAPVKAKSAKPARAKKAIRTGGKRKAGGQRNGAVAKAIAIFSKNPRAKRAEQIKAAVAAGINVNTAKTQFQKWTHRGDR